MFNKDVVLWRVGCLLLLWIGAAAKQVSPNFEVEAPTESIARQVATTAERCRRELAVDWLGHELPNWSGRCQVRVKVGQIGAGGATTFSFSEGEVFGWNMTVQGSLERILDSVIPHEVSHTIFACHFRRPLPRWADEGAATLAEEDSERRRQQKLAEEVLPTNRRIPLRDLLQITEYPKNMQQVLTLYAEGYSLADYLVQQHGKRRFLTFVQEAHELGWETALTQHYGEKGIDSLESKWSQWVMAGSPSLQLPDGQLLTEAKTPQDSTLTRSASEGLETVTRSESEGLYAAKVSLPLETNSPDTTASVFRSQTPDAKTSDRKSKLDLARPEMKYGSKLRVESLVPAAPTKGRLLASNATGGHSLTPNVSAPEPRRRRRSPEINSNSVSHEPSQDSSPQNSAELRRSRGPHLSKPELRRVPELSNSDEVPAHPSPFAPVGL